MNQYEKAVLEVARKWYEAWGKSGVDELWSAVGEMCERERLRQPTQRATDVCPRSTNRHHEFYTIKGSLECVFCGKRR